jgi:hypothetical protein
MAKWLMIAGITILTIGILLQYAPWLFSWFGKLPGDIRVETANVRVFIPISSMLIISIVLTLIINLFRR